MEPHAPYKNIRQDQLYFLASFEQSYFVTDYLVVDLQNIIIIIIIISVTLLICIRILRFVPTHDLVSWLAELAFRNYIPAQTIKWIRFSIITCVHATEFCFQFFALSRMRLHNNNKNNNRTLSLATEARYGLIIQIVS